MAIEIDLTIGIPAAPLVAALCILGPAPFAHAQAYSCYRPSELRVPSGYSLDEHDHDRLAREAAVYLADMQDYIECLHMEYENALDELDDVADSLDRVDEEFSKR